MSLAYYPTTVYVHPSLIGTVKFLCGVCTHSKSFLLQVVRSLKNSMQPGATSITVQFHLPSYECVFKAPKVIPSLFSGEKLVVYGIFKSSEKGPATLQGKAILKYTICGKEATVEVPFVAMEQVPVIPVVHHLAAKQRLLELKGSGNHQVMINLSIESSVVCPQTAFFAVDETSQQPISGPLKTFDLCSEISVAMPQQQQCAQQQQQHTVAMEWEEQQQHYPIYDALCLSDEVCEQDLLCADLDMNLPPVAGAALFDGFEFSRSCKSMRLESPSGASDSRSAKSAAMPLLSSLVALQLANGSWSLTGALSSELGKELKVVEDSCPSGCPSAVWATALALSSLKLTYSSQQDEWELVAKKAESWLRNQSLPTGLTLQSVHSEAEKLNKLLVSF